MSWTGRDLVAAPVVREPIAARAPQSVAIVHDYLNQGGGAERVVLELARIWPGAPIYTSLYRPQPTFAEFEEPEVRTSARDRVPVDRSFRALAPLFPLAFRNLGALDHDLVVGSSSGWAHCVRTGPDTVHVVYGHTPARWLHRPDEYIGHSLRRGRLTALSGSPRCGNHAATRRWQVCVANCENVRRRIRLVYDRGAEVVYPPVDVRRFTPRPPKGAPARGLSAAPLQACRADRASGGAGRRGSRWPSGNAAAKTILGGRGQLRDACGRGSGGAVGGPMSHAGWHFNSYRLWRASRV